MPDDQILIFALTDLARASDLADGLRQDVCVRDAAVVNRTPDGDLKVLGTDGHATADVEASAGGLIKALVDVLGGPVGVLLGLDARADGADPFEPHDAQDDNDGLAVLARGIGMDSTVVIAEITDPTFPAEDRAITYGAQVVRIPAAQVVDEVATAQSAAQDAARQARAQRRGRRKSDFSGRVHRFFDRPST